LPSAADASATRSASSYDGRPVEALAFELGVPRVVAFDSIGSTLDVAHELAAAGAAPGTLVVADAQTSGRGRMGRVWRSEPGVGVWLTLVERPRDVAALDVLSLRIGLALAPELDAFAAAPVRLKWPNDLYIGRCKLGGVLVEARWRDSAPEWAAIGVGVNVLVPDGDEHAAGLASHATRSAVLSRIVPAMRAAAAKTGPLDRAELDAFATRDAAAGRRCREPVAGLVRGIDASGALVVEIGSDVAIIRAGSLVLEEEL
jgi:BirA family biotin operon repressor/biotin-[acetyl-CoA-carboxylase] ligase